MSYARKGHGNEKHRIGPIAGSVWKAVGPEMGVSEQRYVNSHRAAIRGIHENARQKTVDLAVGSRPPASSGDSVAALVPQLDGLDEWPDSVDLETPKIFELKLV